MKKTYINPNLNVVELKITTSLLAISGDSSTLNGGSNGDYSTSGGITLGGRDNDGDDW